MGALRSSRALSDRISTRSKHRSGPSNKWVSRGARCPYHGRGGGAPPHHRRAGGREPWCVGPQRRLRARAGPHCRRAEGAPHQDPAPSAPDLRLHYQGGPGDCNVPRSHLTPFPTSIRRNSRGSGMGPCFLLRPLVARQNSIVWVKPATRF